MRNLDKHNPRHYKMDDIAKCERNRCHPDREQNVKARAAVTGVGGQRDDLGFLIFEQI